MQTAPREGIESRSPCWPLDPRKAPNAQSRLRFRILPMRREPKPPAEATPPPDPKHTQTKNQPLARPWITRTAVPCPLGSTGAEGGSAAASRFQRSFSRASTAASLAADGHSAGAPTSAAIRTRYSAPRKALSARSPPDSSSSARAFAVRDSPSPPPNQPPPTNGPTAAWAIRA